MRRPRTRDRGLDVRCRKPFSKSSSAGTCGPGPHERNTAFDRWERRVRGFALCATPGTKPLGRYLQLGVPGTSAHQKEQNILIAAQRRLRAGRTTAILLAGIVALLSGTVAMPSSAAAQSAGSAIDQPTAGTLPPGTSTVKGSGAAPRDQSTGHVAPPSAIQSSTDVMQSEGTVQGKSQGGRTDPIKHLPKDMRR